MAVSEKLQKAIRRLEDFAEADLIDSVSGVEEALEDDASEEGKKVSNLLDEFLTLADQERLSEIVEKMKKAAGMA